jgi:hypothetical protein
LSSEKIKELKLEKLQKSLDYAVKEVFPVKLSH